MASAFEPLLKPLTPPAYRLASTVGQCVSRRWGGIYLMLRSTRQLFASIPRLQMLVRKGCNPFARVRPTFTFSRPLVHQQEHTSDSIIIRPPSTQRELCHPLWEGLSGFGSRPGSSVTHSQGGRYRPSKWFKIPVVFNIAVIESHQPALPPLVLLVA